MSTSVLHHPQLAPRATTGAPGFWQRLWIAIERHGQRRAAAELRRVASHHVFSDPELSRQLLAAADQTERA